MDEVRVEVFHSRGDRQSLDFTWESIGLMASQVCAEKSCDIAAAIHIIYSCYTHSSVGDDPHLIIKLWEGNRTISRKWGGKGFIWPSVHVVTSVSERPEIASSSGERRNEQADISRVRILYAPMNDYIAPTFCGGEHEDNTQLWHWLAVSMPCDQIQPWIVVHVGLIILLEIERRKCFLWKAARTLV